MNTAAVFEELVADLGRATEATYGDRLVSLALFGSVARGGARPDSDVDVLIVARDLPAGRMPRVAEFGEVERRLGPALARAASAGVHTRISPILKTPDEAARGSPVFLDMVEDARILVDHLGFLAGVLARLRERLARLGARRIWKGTRWYWDLKPDYRPGDEIEL